MPKKKAAPTAALVHYVHPLGGAHCGVHSRVPPATSTAWPAVTCPRCLRYRAATRWCVDGKGASARAFVDRLRACGKTALAHRIVARCGGRDTPELEEVRSALTLDTSEPIQGPDIRRIERAFFLASHRSCGRCGCVQEIACEGGCSWVAARICSACDTEDAA